MMDLVLDTKREMIKSHDEFLVVTLILFWTQCWYNDSFAQDCLLLGTSAQVRDVAHGPLVLNEICVLAIIVVLVQYMHINFILNVIKQNAYRYSTCIFSLSNHLPSFEKWIERKRIKNISLMGKKATVFILFIFWFWIMFDFYLRRRRRKQV